MSSPPSLSFREQNNEQGDYTKVRNKQLQPIRQLCDYYSPPQPCWYGLKCRHKLTCSHSHGVNELCDCSDETCLKGHPLRRRQTVMSKMYEHVGRRPPADYVCNRCQAVGEHYLNVCPENRCVYCRGFGHVATFCPQKNV